MALELEAAELISTLGTKALGPHGFGVHAKPTGGKVDAHGAVINQELDQSSLADAKARNDGGANSLFSGTNRIAEKNADLVKRYEGKLPQATIDRVMARAPGRHRNYRSVMPAQVANKGQGLKTAAAEQGYKNTDEALNKVSVDDTMRINPNDLSEGTRKKIVDAAIQKNQELPKDLKLPPAHSPGTLKRRQAFMM